MIMGTKLVMSWAAASDPDDSLLSPVVGGDRERRGGCDVGFECGLSYGLGRPLEVKFRVLGG